MSEAIQEVRKEMTDYYSRLFEDFGMSPTMIKVYVSLFFSKDPLGLQEIADDTGYSISTICQSADILERYTDVRKSKKPGSKKVYYECTHDIKKAVRKKIAGQREMIQGLITLLKNSEDKLNKDDNSDAKRIEKHISQLRKDYEKVDKMFSVLETVHLIR